MINNGLWTNLFAATHPSYNYWTKYMKPILDKRRIEHWSMNKGKGKWCILHSSLIYFPLCTNSHVYSPGDIHFRESLWPCMYPCVMLNSVVFALSLFLSLSVFTLAHMAHSHVGPTHWTDGLLAWCCVVISSPMERTLWTLALLLSSVGSPAAHFPGLV